MNTNVTLLCLKPDEYRNFQMDDGRMLIDVFPDQIFVCGTENFETIFEVAGVMTPAMVELFGEIDPAK